MDARPAVRALCAVLTLLIILLVGCRGSAAPALRPSEEQRVSFASGAYRVYGSLLLPDRPAGRRVPAAVIIGGSGPTDRNGNSRLLPGPVDSSLAFARALAAQGVASLRYDKLGSGETGLGSVTDPSGLGFDVFVAEAQAALAFLRSHPEVDPARVLLLGHSEGALIALVLTDRLGGEERPRALVLAAPPGERYLDVLRRQVAEQYAEQARAGRVTESQAETAVAETDRVIASLRTTGALPERIWPPAIGQLFRPGVATFLAEADRHDPSALAAALPPDLPVLVLRGAKDQQVSARDVRRLMEGFAAAGNARAESHELADVNHVFKEVPGAPNPAADYTNPALPFSHEATTHLAAFLAVVR